MKLFEECLALSEGDSDGLVQFETELGLVVLMGHVRLFVECFSRFKMAAVTSRH